MTPGGIKASLGQSYDKHALEVQEGANKSALVTESGFALEHRATPG